MAYFDICLCAVWIYVLERLDSKPKEGTAVGHSSSIENGLGLVLHKVIS
jgi:hypothetical protein